MNSNILSNTSSEKIHSIDELESRFRNALIHTAGTDHFQTRQILYGSCGKIMAYGESSFGDSAKHFDSRDKADTLFNDYKKSTDIISNRQTRKLAKRKCDEKDNTFNLKLHKFVGKLVEKISKSLSNLAYSHLNRNPKTINYIREFARQLNLIKSKHVLDPANTMDIGDTGISQNMALLSYSKEFAKYLVGECEFDDLTKGVQDIFVNSIEIFMDFDSTTHKENWLEDIGYNLTIIILTV
ncbi:hypothetical protein GJ496_004281 [Pomphorhynchus laevis]|nr:hypothetical protein GJ496_004281 [Pomphorhynchus laevis]